MAAVSLVALGMSGAAYAQTGNSTPDQAASDTVVVVHGFRASLQSALSAKRKSDLPIESVAPEDIGKMPDQNVAESLQRLPGVQIDRSQGKGTAVLIDGLRQNLTTLNGESFLTGKEFYVSGEGSGGGAGGNSQYGSLEGIPSEEIGRIDVYKSPNASLNEGGLGGIVDLRTRDPLDQPNGFTLGGNVRETKADGDSKTTPNLTLVGSYKPNSRFAVTASVSYDDEDTHTKEFEDYNRSPWMTSGSATGNYTGPLLPAYQTSLPNGQTYMIPEYEYFSDIFDKRKTTGASLGIAWKMSDSVRSTLTWFYSKEDDVNIDYSTKVGFNGSGNSVPNHIPGINPSAAYAIDGNGVVTAAQFQLTGSETATLYQHNVSNANNAQWHTAWNNGGPLTGTFDLVYAHATSNLQADQADVEHGYYSAYGQTASAAPTAPGCNNFAASCTTGNQGFQVAYTNGGTSGLPTVSNLAPYADVLSNPAYTLFKSNWAWANLTKETQSAVKGDLVYKPEFLASVSGSISGGLRLATRDVDQTFGRYLLNGLDSNGNPISNCCSDPHGSTWLYYIDPGYAAIPYSTAVGSPGLAKTVNNFAFGNVIVKDPSTMSDPSTYLQQVWNGASNYPAGIPHTNNTEKFFVDTLSSFKVHEKTASAYLMSDLGAPSNNFHANFGVRIVSTDLIVDNAQSAPVPTFYGSASWNGVNSNNVPVRNDRHYIDVLPSFNFVLDNTEDQKIRFSAARVVSPQDLFSLGVGNSYNFTRETGGRTNIHTGQKDGFKFATGSSGNPNLDPYRANQFYLSWEDYFKPGQFISLAAFYKQVDNFVETQNLTVTVMDDFGGTPGTVSEPVNAGHGMIYGVELGGQYDLGAGFGVAANYTRSQSYSDQVTAFTHSASIPGVSKDAFTGTVYYERGKFQARLSYSWRDAAVNDGLGGATFSVPDANGNPKVYGVFSAPYGQADGQISYDINANVGIVFSAQNIGDAKQHTYLQYKNMPFTWDDAGSRYFLGVRFKY
jgi:TonB-dependent receptor